MTVCHACDQPARYLTAGSGRTIPSCDTHLGAAQRQVGTPRTTTGIPDNGQLELDLGEAG